MEGAYRGPGRTLVTNPDAKKWDVTEPDLGEGAKTRRPKRGLWESALALKVGGGEKKLSTGKLARFG